MKQLVLFLYLFSIPLLGQEYRLVDSLVLQYPKFSKVEALAQQIEKDFSTDIHKARAAFFWIANNLRYDLKTFYNPKKRSYSFRYFTEEEKQLKLQRLKDKLVIDAFANKKGVCEEYAQSFKKICDLLGIEAAVIKGNVRNNMQEIGNVMSTTNHAWNAVKLNEKWLLLDATWAAGFEQNRKWIKQFDDYFYDIPKNKIFKTHLPNEAIWVLRFGRIDADTFYQQPIYSSTFLKASYQLIYPKNGIIRIGKNKNIQLQINNLKSTDLITYVFTEQRYALKPSVLKNGKESMISIPNPNRNASLIIFINKSAALYFKVTAH